MLLKIIPESPIPTILFSLEFGNCLKNVPIPQYWAMQLHQVQQDELEMPRFITAVDKSVWAVALLQEVTFNVVSKTVSCVFVDNTVKEWDMSDTDLLPALRDVLSVVTESSIATEMERNRAKALAAPPTTVVRSSTPVRASKHKRSRSILMSIMSAFCPSQTSSSPPLPLYDLPGQAPTVIPPEPLRSSNSLRRKARADLVDIYRRYILPNLESPFIHGGYVYWNLQSILARIQGQMQGLVKELGGELPHVRSNTSKKCSRSGASGESPSDDNASTTTTDSDASSVHTPRDSMIDCPVMYNASASEDALINAERGIVSPTRTLPMPVPQPHPTRENTISVSTRQSREGPVAEYAVLHASTVRLRSLINRMEANERNMEADRAANLAILEVKAKRRAWSSKILGGRSDLSLAGLASPLRSSPLAYRPVLTPETIAETSTGKYFGVPRMPGGRVGSTRPAVSRERGINLGADCTSTPTQPNIGFIPFPQTEPNEDFCSTGPQDTTPLFTGSSESDDFADSRSNSPSNSSSYSSRPAYSSDNLPGMLASLSVSGTDSQTDSDPEQFEDAPELEAPSVPFSSDAFQPLTKVNPVIGGFPGSDSEAHELTLGLDVSKSPVRRHSRKGRVVGSTAAWASEMGMNEVPSAIPECR